MTLEEKWEELKSYLIESLRIADLEAPVHRYGISYALRKLEELEDR